MKAQIRKDIQDEGLAVPTKSGGYIGGDNVYQAKYIGDDLFIHDGIQWVGVESIDFELFEEDETFLDNKLKK